MKFSLPFLLAACLMLASCVSPTQRRIEKNPDLYNALNEHQKELVQHGAIEEGMSKEAVFLAWGKPDRGSRGSKLGKAYERWSYAGYEPAYMSPYGPAYGWASGPWVYDPYFYPGPPVTMVPYEARWVEFLNNRVSGWSRASEK